MVPPTPNFYIPLIERDRPLMPGNNIHFKRFNINPTYCFKWPPLQTIMQHLHHCMQAQGWERRRSCRTASAVWPWCCCSGVQLLCCCNLQTHDFPQQCRCCAARYCACKHTFVHSAAGAVLQGAVHARCCACKHTFVHSDAEGLGHAVQGKISSHAYTWKLASLRVSFIFVVHSLTLYMQQGYKT